MSDAVTLLAERVGQAARQRVVMIAAAESCTGGAVAEAITRISGSSAWFERGFVTYTNTAKVEMLGVLPGTLADFGAVSEAVARQMAAGALAHSAADVAVAITGIAGPTGGTPAKPVGLVWIAWTYRGGDPQCRRFHFRGDRAAIRRQSVEVALQGLVDLLG